MRACLTTHSPNVLKSVPDDARPAGVLKRMPDSAQLEPSPSACLSTHGPDVLKRMPDGAQSEPCPSACLTARASTSPDVYRITHDLWAAFMCAPSEW